MTSLAPAKAAKLPVSYERAKQALENCRTLDECKDWKDKAAALASYAKQANDEELFKSAMLIKGRAVRRMGELLKEIEPKRGANQNIRGGDSPKVQTRTAVAEAAGLSPDQTKQALRIASIPKREFERAIEAEKPPTLTALAKQGTKPAAKPSTDHLKGRSPEDFSASIKARGAMHDMADMCGFVAPTTAVRGAAEYDLPKMRAWAATIVAWVERLQKELKER